MFDFVDLHCHLLFSVDDGASSEDETKKLLDIAYKEGVRYICFTPHFKLHRFENEDEIISYNRNIENIFTYISGFVSEQYPDLHIYLGNEIMNHHDIASSLQNSFCKNIADGKYTLVEFNPASTEFELTSAVSRMVRRGLHPIIAHVERYGALVKKPALLKDLKDMGALIQINSSSILKFKIGKTATFLKYILKNSLVDIVASDAHNLNFPPQFLKSEKAIEKKYGYDYAKKIFYDIPIKVLENHKIF